MYAEHTIGAKSSLCWCVIDSTGLFGAIGDRFVCKYATYATQEMLTEAPSRIFVRFFLNVAGRTNKDPGGLSSDGQCQALSPHLCCVVGHGHIGGRPYLGSGFLGVCRVYSALFNGGVVRLHGVVHDMLLSRGPA